MRINLKEKQMKIMLIEILNLKERPTKTLKVEKRNEIIKSNSIISNSFKT
nr:MAG TPA: hypothetical protein [Bacteriophage sp.]